MAKPQICTRSKISFSFKSGGLNSANLSKKSTLHMNLKFIIKIIEIITIIREKGEHSTLRSGCFLTEEPRTNIRGSNQSAY